VTTRQRRVLRVHVAAALLPLFLSAVAHAQQRMPPGFVALSDIDPSIRRDMRYAGPDNFTGRPLPGYTRGACWLYRDVALALKRVQADVAARGLSLKVYDCYRPQRAVAAMVNWAASPERADMRRFYPAVDKRRLLARGYIASPSAHSRGIAVDLTLVPRDVSAPDPYDQAARYGSCTAERTTRAPDGSIDMGTGFDCFDPKSRTLATGLTAQQHANRMLLVNAMRRRGFHNYAREWWHFTFPAADARQRYDFPIR
jgi:D-alanyl-D-alanine dipeptidase